MCVLKLLPAAVHVTHFQKAYRIQVTCCNWGTTFWIWSTTTKMNSTHNSAMYCIKLSPLFQKSILCIMSYYLLSFWLHFYIQTYWNNKQVIFFITLSFHACHKTHICVAQIHSAFWTKTAESFGLLQKFTLSNIHFVTWQLTIFRLWYLSSIFISMV